MSHFNYRIFKEIEKIPTGEDGIIEEEVYTIRQVGYDDNKNPINYTASPHWPVGNSIQDLKGEIEYMMRAFNRTVLTKENFEDGTTISK